MPDKLKECMFEFVGIVYVKIQIKSLIKKIGMQYNIIIQ